MLYIGAFQLNLILSYAIDAISSPEFEELCREDILQILEDEVQIEDLFHYQISYHCTANVNEEIIALFLLVLR